MRFHYLLYTTLTRRYWEFLFESANNESFKLVKSGIFSACQHTNTNGWEVGEITDLDSNNTGALPQGFVDIKRNNHPLSREVIQPGKDVAKRIIMPCLLFRK